MEFEPLFNFDSYPFEQRQGHSDTIYARLLSVGAIDPSQYPPRDKYELSNLVRLISQAEISSVNKSCLVYYLLKRAGREDAISGAYLSRKQRRLMDAYHSLDTHAYAAAVDALAGQDNIDFQTHILQTLADAHPCLLLRFVRTYKQPLSDDENSLVIAAHLQQGNLAHALARNRAHSPDPLEGFQSILTQCFTQPYDKALQQLDSIPLSVAEANALDAFCTDPPAHIPQAARLGLEQVLVKRLENEGQYIKAIRALSATVKVTAAEQQQRISKKQQLLERLPPLQRTALQLDPSDQPSAMQEDMTPVTNIAWSTSRIDSPAKPASLPLSASTAFRTGNQVGQSGQADSVKNVMSALRHGTSATPSKANASPAKSIFPRSSMFHNRQQSPAPFDSPRARPTSALKEESPLPARTATVQGLGAVRPFRYVPPQEEEQMQMDEPAPQTAPITIHSDSEEEDDHSLYPGAFPAVTPKPVRFNRQNSRSISPTQEPPARLTRSTSMGGISKVQKRGKAADSESEMQHQSSRRSKRLSMTLEEEIPTKTKSTRKRVPSAQQEKKKIAPTPTTQRVTRARSKA